MNRRYDEATSEDSSVVVGSVLAMLSARCRQQNALVRRP